MSFRTGFGSDDRGVSDVVGYVLIFSLIVATVGVVTTVGFGTLDDRQDAERINNVERAFDVFANNMENVYRDGAPSRATEMRLAGGTLRHGDAINITIESPDGDTVTTSPRPLTYEDGNTKIIYVGGALIRSDDGSAVMLRDPPFPMGADTASFPMIDTFHTSGAQTVSVDGTIRVTSTALRINTTVPQSFDTNGDYNVTVESPRSDAWARYFEDREDLSVADHQGETVRATISSDGVSVPRFRTRLRFAE